MMTNRDVQLQRARAQIKSKINELANLVIKWYRPMQTIKSIIVMRNTIIAILKVLEEGVIGQDQAVNTIETCVVREIKNEEKVNKLWKTVYESKEHIYEVEQRVEALEKNK